MGDLEQSESKLAKLSWFACLCFVCIWSLSSLAILANPIAGKDTFAFKTDGGNTSVSDFVQFYDCGRICLSDQRQQIYEPEVQMKFTNEAIQPERIEHAFYMQYVPFIPALMAPLAVLPLPAAYSAWYFLSLAAGLSILVLLNKSAGDSISRRDQLLIIFSVLASIPSIIALKIGQSSWFLLCFVGMFFLGILKGKEGVGGAGLALSTIKPQYAPLLGLTALSARRWKLVIVSIAIELGLMLVAGLTIGWNNTLNFPAIVLNAETNSEYQGVNPEGMVSLRGLLSILLPQKSVLAASAILIALAAFYVFYLWQEVRKEKISRNWAIALTILLCLVVSPHTHVYDLLLLSIPAVITFPKEGLSRVLRSGDVFLRCWWIILMLFPILSWLFYCFKIGPLLVIPNVLLLVFGTIFVFRSKKT